MKRAFLSLQRLDSFFLHPPWRVYIHTENTGFAIEIRYELGLGLLLGLGLRLG